MKELRLMLLCSLLLCCEHTNRLRLTFEMDDDDGGTGLPNGFECESSQGEPLLTRAGGDLSTVNLVFDFVRLDGGQPQCADGKSLDEYCKLHSCEVVRGARICLSMPAVEPGTGEPWEKVRESLRRLEGTILRDDAPDGVVAVRLVATVQSCTDVASIEAGFVEQELIGCAYTCPTHLDQTTGDLVIDASFPPLSCESAVQRCATVGAD